MDDKEKTTVAIFCVAIMLTVSVGAIINSVPNPVAVANASQSVVNVNDALTFSATGSSTGANSYEWLFRDNTPIASGFTVTHAFTMEGIYEVGLLVKIGGKTALGLVKITVRNYYPEARAVHDPIACEDEVKTFDASTSTDQNGADDIASYYWEFGDGSTSDLKTASHSFAKEGVYVVTLTVTDTEGAKGTEKSQITIQNRVPTANAGSDRIVNEDDAVGFNAGGSTDTPSDVNSLTYYWDFGDGTTGNGIFTSHKYAERGVYNAQLTVTDDDGESDIDDTVVTVTNVVPTANAGPDQSALEGQTVLFDGAATTDTPTDLTILIYDWSFGGVGINPTYSWVENGNYVVIMTATDDDSASSTDSTAINVLNVPPTTGVTRVFIDSDITLRASGEKWHDLQLSLYKDDELDSTMSLYRIPGGPDEQSATLPKYSFDLTASYHAVISYTPENDPINGQIEGSTPAWFILTFKDGSYEFIQNEFNYNNPEGWNWTVYPTSYLIGHEITFESLTFDPGLDDVTNTWDFGDGTIASNHHQISASPAYFHESMNHTYESTGLFALELTATDDDDGTCEFSTTINIDDFGTVVENIAPVASILIATAQTDEDSVIQFIGVSKDNARDNDTYQWDFGDGTGANGADVSHAYLMAGIYMVILTVTDGSTAANRVAVFVKVNNVVPIAESGIDRVLNEDDTAFFNAGATVDTPSDWPILTYHWDFGDGTLGNGISTSHVYTKVGIYIVTLIVTDNDGASDTDTLTVAVNNVAPTANAGPSQSANEDRIVFFSGTATDTPTDWQILSYSWTFGDGGIGQGKNPTHSYVNAGTYSVALVVNDNNGATATSSLQVTVSNVVPIMTMSGYPATAKLIWAEAVHYQFDANAIDTFSDQNLLTYDWDFGDGNSASARNPSHMYTDSGTYIVTLTALDNEGASTTSSLTINVILDSDGDILRDEDEIGVYHTDPFKYDTDGDWLTDYTEVTDVVDSQGRHTDPTKADSDSDGLNDWEERYSGEDHFITDPFNPDTDGDGLIDSQEMFTKVFRTTDRTKIIDGTSSSAGMTNVWLSDVYIAVPYDYLVYKVDVKIGLTHDNISNLGIDLIGAGQSVSLRSWNSVTVGDTKLYTNYNLLDRTTEFSAGMFNQKHTWTLRIWDFKADGSNGFIEYFEIHLTGRTYPTLSDYDGDGVNDYEEINPGNDGWTTEPYIWDTDTDGWNDGYETEVKFTDPTRADTDRDGVIDSQDIDPLHNLFLRITIQTLAKLDNQIDHDVFVGVTYDSKSFFTPHKYAANSGDWYVTFNKVYTIDAPDKINQHLVPITFSAYQLRDTWNPLDYDHEFNLVGGSSMEYSMSYDLTGSTHNFMTSANVNSDSNDITQKWNASLNLNIVTTYADRINTILLNSTEGQSLLLANNDGVHTAWRYTGENKFYVAILNVDSSATGTFTQGYNALLIPRKVFLDSDLNHTLRTTAASDLPAYIGQLGFGLYDDSQSKTTGSIVATLTGPKGSSVYTTGAQANDILNRLLVNVGGQRIIAQYRIVTTQLVTLNLDDDVLKVVPFKDVRFDDTGAGPTNFWGSLINFIAGIGTIILNGLVAIGDFLGDLWNAISSWGMKILSEIASFLSEVVNALVKIAKALVDFVKWIIDWIVGLIQSMLSGIITPIKNAIDGFMYGLASKFETAHTEYVSSTPHSVTQTTASEITQILIGPFFWAVMALGTALAIITTFILGVPLIGLLIALIVPIVFGTIILLLMGSTSPSGATPSISMPDSPTTNAMWASSRTMAEQTLGQHAQDTSWYDALDMISTIFGYMAIAFDALLASAITGLPWVAVGIELAIAIIGVVAGMWIQDKLGVNDLSFWSQASISLTATLIGFIGIVIGILTIPELAEGGPAVMIFGGLGLVFSGIALVTGLGALSTLAPSAPP